MANQPDAASQYLAPTPKILEDFFAQVKTGFLTRTVVIRGFTFVMQTPTEDDETWADNFVRATTPMAFVSSRRAPRLACSIQSINGTNVLNLFDYPTDMTPKDRENMNNNSVQRRYWVYSQMMAQLAKLPPPVVEELYSEYAKLIEDRDKALVEVAAVPTPN
jgi:hypothetical protein